MDNDTFAASNLLDQVRVGQSDAKWRIEQLRKYLEEGNLQLSDIGTSEDELRRLESNVA